MKLISLHIENFGCLQQYDLQFGDGLTVIHEANGFGKTTLAEFIRAMFYGFPRAAKTLDKNRRKKYLPWSGGKCGGHLTFGYDGCAYRIERTFGATPKGDTFNLIDLGTGKKSLRFTENIGVELFQLDAESFERSTYMPQFHDLGSLNTDSIRAKLGNLVEDTNDINNFDKAVAALKEKRTGYMHYKGSGGSVAEARSRISRLQEELDCAEDKRKLLHGIQREITDLEKRRDQMETELKAVRERITEDSRAAANLALRQQYDRLLEQRDAYIWKEKASPLAECTLTQEVIDEARADCEDYCALAARLENTGLSDPEQAQLSQLERFFAPGIPDEQELENLAWLHREVLRLETVAESQRLSSQEQRQKEELAGYFVGRYVNREMLDRAVANLERAAWLRRENTFLEEKKKTLPAPKNSSKAASVALILLGIIALAAGIGLMTAGRYIPGGTVLGTGVLMLIAGASLALKRMITRELAERGNKAELQQQIASNEAEAVRLEESVFAVTRQFSGGSPEEVLDRVRGNYNRYAAVLRREQELRACCGKTLEELKVCKEALQRELIPYFGTTTQYESAILQLQMRRSRMLDLRAKAEAAGADKEALLYHIGMLQDRLREFLYRFFDEVQPGQFRDLLLQLQRQFDEYRHVCDQRAEADRQIAAFYPEHRDILDVSAQTVAPAPEELKHTEKQLSAAVSELTRSILERSQRACQLRQDIDRIPEIRDALEQWQLRKDADTRNAATLDETVAYLQSAKESLEGNYLGSVRRSFTRLLSRMMGEEPGKVLMTGDLEILLERQGQARELEYFSAGQTDTVMLCMRFALVDALFTGVKPFVILDDPFVNLDDARTAEALSLLKELSKDRQIIYLVCNSSRV